MEKLLRLQQQREAEVKKMRAIVEKSDEEKRSLNDQEQGDFEAIEQRIASLDKDIEQEKRLLDLETTIVEGGSAANVPGETGSRSFDNKPDYRSVFFKALRGQRLEQAEVDVLDEQRALSVKEGEDGGYVIPEDITTEINKLKQTVDNLEQYVTVEPVTTAKGARTLEKRAESTPFAPLSEFGDPDSLAEMNAPKFDRLEYNIDDYAGFLPVPNNLLKDSDQNIEAYLRRWIAKKSKATRNHLILELLDTLNKETFENFDAIKDAINVDLDPAHGDAATIFTNQDGFNWMSKQKDGNGRYLMQPDPTNAARKQFDGRPVVKLSNRTISTEDNLAPVIVGDLKEAIVLWDREQMSLDMTTTGGQAWRTNSTEFRAIEREDVSLWDNEAVVYGQIDVSGSVEA